MNKAYSLKKRIANKEVLVGLFYKFNSQAIVEMVGHAGFDFIIVDAEHSNYSAYDIEGIIRAAECVQMGSIVRLREAKSEDVLHALDSGADGVQIPSITSVETALEVCKSTKYYPEGNRGLSLTQRAANYSVWQGKDNYYQHSNENSLVVVHVENVEMANQIDALLEVPQIDVIFVGPGDLSQSLGKPGQMNDPEVVAVIEGIFKKVLAKGKAVGIYCGTQAAVKKYVDLGATYIAYGSDITVMASGLKALKETISFLDDGGDQ
jgi:4-hydroxy-2-oxoheptanedioate aldolase